MDMNLGVVTRSFPQLTNKEVAELLAGEGFRCTELCLSQTDSNYWVYNGRSDLAELTPARCRKIVQTYRDCGIDVPVLGVFTSLIEPDDDERQANLDYFEQMMKIASDNGIPNVARVRLHSRQQGRQR